MTNQKRRNPDFLGIGVQRSGTTYIQRCLQMHPQIGMPQRGLHFFSHRIDYNQDLRDVTPTDLQWYETQMGQWEDKPVVGEFSVSYSFPEHLEQSARSIYEHYPDVKIILALRNPVNRLISEFRRLQERSEVAPNCSFENFFSTHTLYVERGIYTSIVNTYLSLFPRENIHIKIYENLLEDPYLYSSSLFNFLEVSPDLPLEAITNPNPSLPPSRSPRGRLVNAIRITGGLLRKLGFGFFVEQVRSSNFWNQLRVWGAKKKSLPTHVRQQIYEHYEKDILALETLLDIDLSGWKIK